MLKSENNRIVIEEPNGCINYGNIGPRPFRFVRFVYLDLHLYNRGEANQSQMSNHVRGGGAWRSLTARRRWRGALPGSSRRRGGGAEEAESGGAALGVRALAAGNSAISRNRPAAARPRRRP